MKKLLFGSAFNSGKLFDITWLFFRFQLGASIAIGAGLPKINGSGGSPDWFIKQVEGLGFTFPTPGFWAAAASWGEFLGGILIAFGLLTRLASLQLVFQFFIIAFFWYDEPNPLTGMYYQNLLFWSFLLITIGGGGKYSVDSIILKGKHYFSFNKKLVATSVITFLLFISSVAAQSTDSALLKKGVNDVLGKWTGTLEYLDYRSHQKVKLPSTLDVKETGKDIYDLSFDFPTEKGHGWNEKAELKYNEGLINDVKILALTMLPGEKIQFVLEEEGEDDNRKAIIRKTYIMNNKSFSITKLVKYNEQEDWLQRNQFVFNR
jgi:uncharacterized membrane protein YphA (DoxX/SURF4 family)